MFPIESFEKEIKKIYPLGVYHLDPEDPNYTIYKWFYKKINLFLESNAQYFKIENPQFGIIYHYGFNAIKASIGNYTFIGLTKGLIDFTSFLFRNIFQHEDFLDSDLKIDSEKELVVISKENFISWVEFRAENNIKEQLLEYAPINPDRKIIAEALIEYFLYFTVLHEIGHSKQKLTISNDNIRAQVREMDADKFAIIKLGNHLMALHNEPELINKKSNSVFFCNKIKMIRYISFMVFLYFYILSKNSELEDSKCERTHPDPSLRLKYVFELLINHFVLNSFLTVDEANECGRQAFDDFSKGLKKIFPNAEIIKFYNKIIDKDFEVHYLNLTKAAKNLEGLNGNY